VITLCDLTNQRITSKMSELRHRLKDGEVSSSDEVRWQKCKTETCKTSQNMTPPDYGWYDQNKSKHWQIEYKTHNYILLSYFLDIIYNKLSISYTLCTVSTKVGDILEGICCSRGVTCHDHERGDIRHVYFNFIATLIQNNSFYSKRNFIFFFFLKFCFRKTRSSRLYITQKCIYLLTPQ